MCNYYNLASCIFVIFFFFLAFLHDYVREQLCIYEVPERTFTPILIISCMGELRVKWLKHIPALIAQKGRGGGVNTGQFP